MSLKLQKLSERGLKPAKPRWATPRNPHRRTVGGKIAAISQQLGNEFMPWQQLVADVAGEIDDEGLLYYRQIIILVMRQSGKTTLLMPVHVHRALAYLTPQNIIYGAQNRVDARKKIEDDQLPILQRSPFNAFFTWRATNGMEAIKWKNGSRLTLLAGTDKAGHGSTNDLVTLDEVFAQVDARAEQAVLPSMSTRPDPQLWIVSTAGTEKSLYLKDKVDLGRKLVEDGRGEEARIAYFEWSIPDEADISDPDVWQTYMPAYGITINEDFVRTAYESMDINEFRRAFGNQWVDKAAPEPPFNPGAWERSKSEGSQIASRMAFAIDVKADSSGASIAVCGMTENDQYHIELIDNRPGTGWVAARIQELLATHGDAPVVLDERSASKALIPAFDDAAVSLTLLNTSDVVKSCGMIYEAVNEGKLVHIGQPELDVAVYGARKRPIGDAWGWGRKISTVDITPIVAATFAVWACAIHTDTDIDWDAWMEIN